MLLKINLLIFHILFVISTYSQEIFVIADRDSKTPIPFANIKTNRQVYYSNIDGKIEKNILMKKDSFTISCIGYQSNTFYYSNKIDTLFLEPYTIQIKTVDITPLESRKTMEVGYHNKRSFFPNHFIGKDSLVLAVYIPNENGKKQINEIIYALSQLKKSDQFIALLFEVDKNQQPHNVIYKKTIDTKSLNRKGIINISNEHIFFPENGLFVGFAWISENKKYDVNLYEEIKVKVFDDKNTVNSFLFRYNQWESIKPIVPRFGLTLFK